LYLYKTTKIESQTIKMPKGSCVCGEIKYEFTGSPLIVSEIPPLQQLARGVLEMHIDPYSLPVIA